MLLRTDRRPFSTFSVAVLSLVVSGCVSQGVKPQPGSELVSSGATRPIVLLSDCGVEIDDQWAITHILLSRQLDMRAIITAHASTVGISADSTAAATRKVLDHLAVGGSGEMPQVRAGSNEPLVDARTPRKNSGVDLLIEQSKGFSDAHRLTVLLTGASTDLASALLMDPSIGNRISVIAIGFEDWPDGGEEFNVRNDPVAWQVVLQSDVPLAVGSATVAKRDLLLNRVTASTLIQSHGELGKYLYSLYEDWLNQQPDLVASMVAPDSWPVWDEIVVAYVLGMASGTEQPRPQLGQNMVFTHPATSRRITWLTKVDTERVWQDFVKKVDKYQSQAAD